MGQLFEELKRRNVLRVAIAYIVTAWLLLQVADVVLNNIEAPEWVFQVILLLVALGFPFALIFAWAFELTPEGLKREHEVDRSESITHITGRKLDFMIITVLVLALGYFAFDKFMLDPSRDAELVQTTTEAIAEQAAEFDNAETADKSIAVLAFADLSPEGDQEYFSDGVSEEILNVLAQIPDLQVTSRSSAFSFKGKGLDIPTVAKQLGVANILEGSVRRSGKRIRITAQLIDARNGFHLWSETYDRELEDIFTLQDEIAAAIVEALKEHLGLQVAVAPRMIAAANTEAHDAYLRGRHLVVQRSRTTLEGAVRELEKAIALDPDYSLAHAELAIATMLLIRSSYGDLTDTDAFARATPHAEQAMALDPTLAEAHAATGFLLYMQGNLEEALPHFEQAIQINPNYSIVYTWTGNIYGQLGRYKEEFAMVETALRLDPLSRPAIANRFYRLIDRNRLAEADRELEKLASIAPALSASIRGFLTSLGGKWANAVLARLDALRIDPERLSNALPQEFATIGLEKEALAISEHPLPVALTRLGRPRDAVTTAEARLAEDPDSLIARRDLGLALAGAGDYARAQPILEEMWQRSGERVTLFGLFDTTSAAALIAIRRNAGEEDEVGEVVAAIRDNVRRYHEAGITNGSLNYSVDYEEGLAAFLTGERERGLALIAKGAEDGYFIPHREAYLQALYDDPGFAPIRASQAARQAHERERFLAIVCNDNPYAAFWQPAEGTCERFAAVGVN